MYLRKTSRKNNDGSTVEYYQLAHNERHPVTKKPVAKIIHSFGRADQCDREQLVRLCKSIARVCNLKVVDPLEQNEKQDDLSNWPEDFNIIKTRPFGPVLVIEELWKRLGIHKTVQDICNRKRIKAPYERALFAMVANRLCEPKSKLGVWDKWLSYIHLPSCKELKLDHMYEAMDMLHEHADEIEKNIFFRTANLFNLSVDLIFYDTTTASFEIDQEDDFRKYGRAKEGGWGPQVIVALAVTREGLPVRSWIFPGNTSDVDTIATIRKDLRGWELNRALFVADAGMNSHDNRIELSKACGKYLLACRMINVKEINEEVLTKRGRYVDISDNLKAKEVVIGDGERRRRYFLCYNPKEAKKQQKHRNQVVFDLEEKLSKHPDKSATAKWAIDLLASKRYRRYLTITKNKKVRIDRSKIKAAKRYDGKWVIQTNDDTISLEDAACGYRSLMVIERCFRSMKRTQIKMMPMYHRLSRRIEAHVRICVLSLLIERSAELVCERPWNQIKTELEEIQVTELLSINYRIFRRNNMTPDANSNLKKLKISKPKKILSIENCR